MVIIQVKNKTFQYCIAFTSQSMLELGSTVVWELHWNWGETDETVRLMKKGMNVGRKRKQIDFHNFDILIKADGELLVVEKRIVFIY